MKKNRQLNFSHGKMAHAAHHHKPTRKDWIAKTIKTFIRRPQAARLGGGLLVLLLAAGFLFHNQIGSLVWQKTKNARLALLFNNEATLAFSIGNYFFNGEKNGVYDLSRAEKYFELALKRDPRTPRAWHNLARIAFVKSNINLALLRINKEIEMGNGTYPNAYYMKGLILGYMLRFSEAEESFKKALDLGLLHWATYNDLAWIYFRQGNYTMVSQTAKEGIAKTGENPWLLTSLGVGLLNEKKKTQAREALMKAQALAQKLTEQEWVRAYPGNNPAKAKEGIEKIQELIAYNLSLAEKP